MAEYLRLARFYFLILAIVTTARWIVSLEGKPFGTYTDKFSIVIVTLLSSIFYGAFCRRWRGFKLGRAAMMGLTLGLAAQIVVFVSTVAAVLLGLDTYFNKPATALLDPAAGGAVTLGGAVAARAVGLVVNTLMNGIAGALGWAMGALLPE